jgi:hypothetical protein
LLEDPARLKAAIRAVRARRSLIDFILLTYPGYRAGWFQREVCSKLDAFLDAVRRRESPRLMIFAPPRHGKSQIFSRHGPAYALGRDPDLNIIATSYSADLASRMNRDVQRIIDDERYREVFPGVGLSGSNSRTSAAGSYMRTSDIFEVVGHEGVYRSAGVGGGILGMGADCMPAGTLIKTEKGDIDIEYLSRLQYLYRVLTYCHRTGCTEWRPVVASREVEVDELVEIETVGGRRIRSTGEHRFYVPGRGYRAASLLAPGDRLRVCSVPIEQGVCSLQPAEARARCDVQAVLSCHTQDDDFLVLRDLQEEIQQALVRVREVVPSGRESPILLLEGMLPGPSSCQPSPQVYPVLHADAGEPDEDLLLSGVQAIREAGCQQTSTDPVSGLRNPISTEVIPEDLLLGGLCQQGTLEADDRTGEFSLQERPELREVVRVDAAHDPGSGRMAVRGLPSTRGVRSSVVAWEDRVPLNDRGPSYQRGCPGQFSRESPLIVQDVPCSTPQVEEDTVAVVRRVRDPGVRVYDIQVEGNRNFFANEILVHNCLIIDDPIKDPEQAYSETYREKLWEWYTMAAYTRLMPGGGILLGHTRWHSEDLAGRLLAAQAEGGDRWDVVLYPAVAEEDEPHRKAGEALHPER